MFQLAIDWFWSVPCVALLVMTGGWLTITSRGYQLRQLLPVIRSLPGYLQSSGSSERGVHPLKAFFASVGGAIGIGNVTAVCIAIHLGGPGAVLWIWVTGFLGMILKYAEVFLGMRYRTQNNSGSYDGGPMYFLKRAFTARWIPSVVALLLCIYGVEVFVFAQVADTIASNWYIRRELVIAVLLSLVLIAGLGGVKRVGSWCGVIVPLFTVSYLGMCLWVFALHAPAIPSALAIIFKSAFTGHAAIGGSIGGSIMLGLAQGAARGCYAGDVGVGYASILHSESSLQEPHRQASFAILSMFLDIFLVCSASVMLVLVSGVSGSVASPETWVQKALSLHFPCMRLFMPVFIFLLGFSTLISYFCVGEKCARFVSPRWGRPVYIAYAVAAFIFFSFFPAEVALNTMALAGGLLLVLNLIGIFRLRKEITFPLIAPPPRQTEPTTPLVS